MIRRTEIEILKGNKQILELKRIIIEMKILSLERESTAELSVQKTESGNMRTEQFIFIYPACGE